MCDHCGCRNIPAIADLTADHDEILTLAWQVVTIADPDLDRDTRAALVDLLDRHARKEEEALYPLLSRSGDLEAAQRDVYEAEHRQFHAALVSAAFDRTMYFALAAHAEAEESELFPMVMFGLDADEWVAMEAVQRAIDEGAPPSTG
jgi:hemerythrin superfamily protein